MLYDFLKFHKKDLNKGTLQQFSNFITSNKAKESLIYPLSFSILNKVNHDDHEKYHDSYSLHYILEGECFLTYNNKTYRLKKGDGCLIDSHLPYDFYSPTTWSSTCLCFKGEPANALMAQYLKINNIKFTSEEFSNFEPLQLHILHCTQKSASYRDYEVSCTFYLLLTNLIIAKSHTSSTEEDIEKIISYIQANYMDNLTIEHLSHVFGMSRSHITRCFKQYTGLTPHQYITQIRIYNAKHLLKTTDRSLEEISNETGFSDATYFIQVFKKIEGISPSKFRK